MEYNTLGSCTWREGNIVFVKHGAPVPCTPPGASKVIRQFTFDDSDHVDKPRER